MFLARYSWSFFHPFIKSFLLKNKLELLSTPTKMHMQVYLVFYFNILIFWSPLYAIWFCCFLCLQKQEKLKQICSKYNVLTVLLSYLCIFHTFRVYPFIVVVCMAAAGAAGCAICSVSRWSSETHCNIIVFVYYSSHATVCFQFQSQEGFL